MRIHTRICFTYFVVDVFRNGLKCGYSVTFANGFFETQQNFNYQTTHPALIILPNKLLVFCRGSTPAAQGKEATHPAQIILFYKQNSAVPLLFPKEKGEMSRLNLNTNTLQRG